MEDSVQSDEARREGQDDDCESIEGFAVFICRQVNRKRLKVVESPCLGASNSEESKGLA